MYGKKEEESVGDIKILEDNQMDNLEDNQREQVFGENDIDFGYEKYIQVSKTTSDRVVYQDQKL